MTEGTRAALESEPVKYAPRSPKSSSPLLFSKRATNESDASPRYTWRYEGQWTMTTTRLTPAGRENFISDLAERLPEDLRSASEWWVSLRHQNDFTAQVVCDWCSIAKPKIIDMQNLNECSISKGQLDLILLSPASATDTITAAKVIRSGTSCTVLLPSSLFPHIYPREETVDTQLLHRVQQFIKHVHIFLEPTWVFVNMATDPPLLHPVLAIKQSRARAGAQTTAAAGNKITSLLKIESRGGVSSNPIRREIEEKIRASLPFSLRQIS